MTMYPHTYFYHVHDDDDDVLLYHDCVNEDLFIFSYSPYYFILSFKNHSYYFNLSTIPYSFTTIITNAIDATPPDFTRFSPPIYLATNQQPPSN